MRLQRDISTGGMLFAAVSATIGSGWLFGSLFAAQFAGPAAILSWVIGAAAVIFVALCFAEVTTMFPVSGSIGIAPYITHGTLVSFSLSLLSWIAFVLIVAIEVQAVLQYMTNMFPWLMYKVDNEFRLTVYGYCAAVLLTALLLMINVIGTRFMARANSLMTIWKILVPVLVIIIFLCANPNFSNLTSHGFAPEGLHGLLASLSVGGIVLAFNGFQPAIALAGECKNPQRSLPLAIVGSMVICMIIYCLLQFSFLVSVPAADLEQGWKLLDFPGDAGPLAGLAVLLGFGWLAFLLYTDALISPLACGLVFFAAAARSSYAMSKKGELPAFLQKLNKDGVPFWSLLICYFIAISFFFFLHSWQAMAAFYAGAICLCNAAIPLSLYTLRSDFPEMKRPYKLFCYKPLASLAFYISNLMLYWCGFAVLWKLDVIVVVGLILFVSIKLKSKSMPFSNSDFRGCIWFFVYLVAMTVASYCGNFEGIGLLSTGMEFVVVGFISILTMLLAYYFRSERHISLQRIDAVTL